MAQPKGSKSQKAKPKKPSAKKAPAKKARAGAKSKTAGARKAAKGAAGKRAKANRGRNGASASGNGGGSAAKASNNGSDAGSAVGAVVEKAKLPLLATGAVVAGAAAVIATKGGIGHKQKKVLGVPVPKGPKVHLPKVSAPKVSAPKLPKGKGLKGDVRRAAGAVTDAAGKADRIGKRISQVASSVQAVGGAADDAAKKS